MADAAECARVSSLSVAAMRRELAARGVSAAGLLEKADFVAALLAAPPAAASTSSSAAGSAAADPQAASRLPYLTTLQAIAAGSRDRCLAEDPGLSYDQAAEVLLLIEALEAEVGG